ncbi:MAG TPA: DUF4461 domain-containing protein [Candidatus Methanoperedenaceae archaeon]|nr:DUF4461 domain-containing protein [Candidatus Methanoperedenaceae archaeon]
MTEASVNRTKSALNALIDVEQLWIGSTPDYKLTSQELLVLKKRLERALENIQKIYDEFKPGMLAAEEEVKKAHAKRAH